MKDQAKRKETARKRRHFRVRSQISGTAKKPRLSVFRSNKFIYAQIIDDSKAKTLVAGNDTKLTRGTKIERAKKVGEEIAKAAVAKKITEVVFDRGGYLFSGRVKALAEGARANGLKF